MTSIAPAPAPCLETEPTPIPTQWVGPIHINSRSGQFKINSPMATYETPLWASTGRGAKAARLSGGINTLVTREGMTRSIVVEGADATSVHGCWSSIQAALPQLQKIVRQTSAHATLDAIHGEIVGRLLFIRFQMTTGEASGHNMVTKAADALIRWICTTYQDLDYVSVSGNMCTDKKVSAVNGILGRGKHVIADVLIPEEICQTVLKTTPEKIHDLNVKKNLVGSIVAGSLRSANAHFANTLLALYLATGQDAANIVEGSQGLVTTDLDKGGLYFSVSLPNLIVGTVGNGKHHPHIQENLQAMGCADKDCAPGENARKLAQIIGATVLCAEISLLAAQTNPGELMQAHESIERGG